MTKTVVIHQPDFIPYLGFFQRFLNSDLFIVQDSVQFSKSGWTHRDKIKTFNGESWISLYLQKHSHTSNINQILLSAGEDWQAKHLKMLKTNYQRAPFFNEIFPHLATLYDNTPPLMASFNYQIIQLLLNFFDIQIPVVFGSNLKARGKSNELLVAQLQEVGATHYLSGIGARNYMKAEKFSAVGINVIWQNFVHPIYPQQFDSFLPYLSSLDLLFNCGILASRDIIRRTQ